MGREFLGYALLGLCLLLLAVTAVRARHNSTRRVYKRRRQADEARWASRDRDAEAPPAD